MSTSYKVVQWNRTKIVYDLILLAGVAGYLGVFFAIGKFGHRSIDAVDDPILAIRALGTCSFLMLTLILCIGPLCRLDRRALPLLYNRRHFGVLTFFIALLHAIIVVGFYHGFGALFPLVSLLTSNTQYASIAAFPFEILGVVGLAILFVMAATSHDFWLKNLTPGVWKSLHMMVYIAWAVLVMHIALGALQSERAGAYVVLTGLDVVVVSGLHLAASFTGREAPSARSGSVPTKPLDQETGWIDAFGIDELRDGRAKVVPIQDGESIAIFRHGQTFSAVSNVCAHQGGPLGEGRIVDGCVTCPWHGYQYRPEDGCSPPPFTEKIPTYRIRVVAKRVQVHVEALPPGTPVAPAKIEGGEA